MRKELESNLWKYFLLMLTNRRNYIPILSIYFLTLPNVTAQQIGLYTGIGWIAGFFLEIPSGYFSDKFGHKQALILSKISLLISTLFFIFGDSLSYFILGSVFISIGIAFSSGTSGAFLHNTLVGLKREKEYVDIAGKTAAKASLVSAVMILALPFLTSISLIMPIKAYLIFDVIGLLVAFLLYSPKIEYSAEDEEGEKIWSQLKRFNGTGFYITSLFTGLLGGFIMGITPFKAPFLESLGLPIVLIGSTMALSRVIWFIVGHNLKILKKIKLQKLLFYEIFFFSGMIILSSQLKNPYLVILILSVMAGYWQGRMPLIGGYYFDNFLLNKRYKATMISIRHQIGKLFEAGIVFVIGFIMVNSFSSGFLVAGVLMFVSLLLIYPFMKNALDKIS